jgi:hypothetical protein
LVDNSKAESYLRRNASGPRGQDEDEEGDGSGEGAGDKNKNEDWEGYEDDYDQNAGTFARPHSSTATNKRACHSEPQTKTRRGYDDDPPLKQKQKHKDDSHDRLSNPAPLPPQPTAADIRRADKVLAREKARDNALGASKDKVGAKPTAAPKGKNKGKGKERETLEEDEYSEDEVSMLFKYLTIFTNIMQPARPALKQVARRGSRTSEHAPILVRLYLLFAHVLIYFIRCLRSLLGPHRRQSQRRAHRRRTQREARQKGPSARAL